MPRGWESGRAGLAFINSSFPWRLQLQFRNLVFYRRKAGKASHYSNASWSFQTKLQIQHGPKEGREEQKGGLGVRI